jgi:hypothetical protein
MSDWYILDNKNKPVLKDVLEAAKWLDENPSRKIVKQEYVDNIHISTVFLGLDHSWPWNKDKTPILWETMIFGGEHDEYQKRYTSYEDALEGHQEAVELVKSSIKEE